MARGRDRKLRTSARALLIVAAIAALLAVAGCGGGSTISFQTESTVRACLEQQGWSIDTQNESAYLGESTYENSDLAEIVEVTPSGLTDSVAELDFWKSVASAKVHDRQAFGMTAKRIANVVIRYDDFNPAQKGEQSTIESCVNTKAAS